MRTQEPRLLTRAQFREQCLERDGGRCVFCGRGEPEVRLDVHHIMERRLWWAPRQLGGYYLENGATCCDTDFDLTDKPVSVHGRPLHDYSCHLLCGMTILSPDDCRRAAGIEVVWLPEHLYGDYALTLWGDPIDEDGNRSRGELFYDESVQLMLKMGGVLPLYTKYVRHFRTLHFPFSPKAVSGDLGDDRVISDLSRFESEPMVVTGKMDGGQSHWYDDYLHLRTLKFKPDPSTALMQACHASIKHHLKGLRLNVEYLIGSSVTGIQYKNLKSFFQIWGIWDNDTNTCLSWDETTEYADQINEIVKTDFGYKMPNGEPMGMPLVPVLYRGPFSREKIESLMTPTLDGDELEGLVVRVAGSFPFGHSAKCVGKFVREHHTVRHGGPYVPNLLAGSI